MDSRLLCQETCPPVLKGRDVGGVAVAVAVGVAVAVAVAVALVP